MERRNRTPGRRFLFFSKRLLGTRVVDRLFRVSDSYVRYDTYDNEIPLARNRTRVTINISKRFPMYRKTLRDPFACRDRFLAVKIIFVLVKTKTGKTARRTAEETTLCYANVDRLVTVSVL